MAASPSPGFPNDARTGRGPGGPPAPRSDSGSDPAAPGAALLARWRRLAGLPLGDRVFSRLLGFRVPYTGALRARVRFLEPGNAVVTLRIRRGLMNHLGSAHAVALTNLGELATGLAVLTALPPGVRGIVLRLETGYLKKGRGTLTAESRWSPSDAAAGLSREPGSPVESWAESVVRDSEGDEVARIRALWLLSVPQ